MKLYCVRHGHAEQPLSTGGEYALSQRGTAEVHKVATYLARQGVAVTHVMHSGKLRAQQTAHLLAHVIGVESEVCTFLNVEYGVDPLLALIQVWHDDTMLVGHMPFMSQLVSALLLADESYDIVRFPPGTVVCLDRIEPQRWMLEWILRPDLVPNRD